MSQIKTFRARVETNAAQALSIPSFKDGVSSHCETQHMLLFGRFVVEAEMNNLESTSEKWHFVQCWLVSVLHGLQSCRSCRLDAW